MSAPKDENDKLSMRDQFAIAILTAMLNDEDTLQASFDFDDEESSHKDESKNILLQSCRSAYKIADMMRKVRIQSFE